MITRSISDLEVTVIRVGLLIMFFSPQLHRIPRRRFPYSDSLLLGLCNISELKSPTSITFFLFSQILEIRSLKESKKEESSGGL